MRGKHVEGKAETEVLESVGLTEAQVESMYRYLAIANYEDRFVIPTSHRELAKEAFPDASAHGERNGCGFSFGEGCNGDSKFNMFGGRKQTTSMVQKLSTVKQVDPKQLQE
jgi:nitrate reductase beta subunit